MEGFWWRLIHLQPAVWRGVVITTFALAASVGVIVAPAIPDALLGFILAAAPMAQALWTRGSVTPNAKVAVVVPDPAQPEVVAPGEAVTTAPPRQIIEAARASGS